MAEIRSSGLIPNSKNLDLVEGEVRQERDSKGFVAVSGWAIEGARRDRIAGGEVNEVVAGGAPPDDGVGSGRHVEVADREGAPVGDVDGASELVLDHEEI